MKVCIAEKPSVAKEIANVIGAKSRKNGYFEGNGYQVTWTFGHFCSLLSPEDYKPQWKKWSLDSLPMLPETFQTKVKSDGGIKKQFNIVKSLFKKANLIINCGDAGTEGELIQRWVISKTGYKGPVKRLWISSLTREAIKKGFDQLRPSSEFDNLYYAASSRAIGDWLLGMNATRLYTLRYGGYKQVLSIGRVQTPTLAMIVKRYHEIINFKPEPYWELETLYRGTGFKYKDGRFDVNEAGLEVLNNIKDHDLIITKVEKKPGKEYAPKLYDLTSLQVHCNNKYGYSADKTLKLVQQLYEQKVVTYPRVDTCYLPDDVYKQVPGILQGLTQYAELTKPLLAEKIRKSKKVFNNNKVTDHHAIIPTGEEKQLNSEQQKVYDMIVRRFLAVFYPDCKTAKTAVAATINELPFHTKGKVIVEPGWRILFPKKKKNNPDNEDEEEEKILPEFKVGEQGPHQPTLKEKITKAPPYYTEATLLRAMETAGKQVEDEELKELMKANGIGRPSTRASIIETLFRRKYTIRKKKQIHPTEMGIQLIGTIKNNILKSAELTGQWEKRLKEIEQARDNPKAFIADMKTMITELVGEVRMDNSTARFKSVETPFAKKRAKKSTPRKKTTSKRTASSATSHSMACPKCKTGTVIKGKTRYGCARFKEGCNFGLPFIIEGKKISDNQIKRLVEKGATIKLKGFKIDKQSVTGIIALDSNYQPIFKAEPTTNAATKNDAQVSCPKCKQGFIIKGKTAYGCSEWKKGCQFRYNFSDIRVAAKGRQLTKELVLKIISQ